MKLVTNKKNLLIKKMKEKDKKEKEKDMKLVPKKKTTCL